MNAFNLMLVIFEIITKISQLEEVEENRKSSPYFKKEMELLKRGLVDLEFIRDNEPLISSLDGVENSSVMALEHVIEMCGESMNDEINNINLYRLGESMVIDHSKW